MESILLFTTALIFCSFFIWLESRTDELCFIFKTCSIVSGLALLYSTYLMLLQLNILWFVAVLALAVNIYMIPQYYQFYKENEERRQRNAEYKTTVHHFVVPDQDQGRVKG